MSSNDVPGTKVKDMEKMTLPPEEPIVLPYGTVRDSRPLSNLHRAVLNLSQVCLQEMVKYRCTKLAVNFSTNLMSDLEYSELGHHDEHVEHH